MLRPLVLTSEAVPVVTDEQAALEDPELAVLSVMAHGRSEVGPAIARVVLKAARQLEGERAMLYLELTLRSLNKAARSALEALMQNFPYKTELARKYFTGVKQARKEALQEGKKEGKREGRQEGRQEGKQEGKQEAVLEVLEARGLRVDAKARERILSCTQPKQIQRWLRRAAVADSLRELFEPGPPPRPTPRRAGPSSRSARARKPSAQ